MHSRHVEGLAGCCRQRFEGLKLLAALSQPWGGKQHAQHASTYVASAFRHPREEYIAMAILHMTNAVSFLNNDCKLVRCCDR